MDIGAFSDVQGSWYASAASWAAASGVVKGYGNGRFGGKDNVTRQDMAVILWRYAGSPADASSLDFADESGIASYAAAAVDWARANGIINGKPGNRFDPRGNATRAEIATMMKNYVEYKEGAESTPPAPPTPPAPSGGKTLAVYFSATGSTKRVAEYIANAADADTFELIPTNPYTSADLNWNASSSRVNREYENESLRNIELVQSTVANWAEYDTVYIGYPIWWGIAAWPVDAFIKFNDFTGKTVVPFCTSTSSGLGESGRLLADMAGTGDWQEGKRFQSSVSDEDVTAWVNSLN